MNFFATASVAASLLLQSAMLASAYECPPEAKHDRADAPEGHVDMCLDAEDRLHGVATTWNADGTVRSRDAWNHGVKHGAWETYHSNGAIRSRTRFEAGTENGLSIAWFDGGQQRSSTTYVNGARQGAIAEWDESGRQIVSGRFADDQPDGTWVFYNPAKNAVFTGTFSRGEPVTTTELSKNTSCTAWAGASSAIRTQFATEVLILILERALEDQVLSESYPLSLASGSCILRHSVELQEVLDEECRSSRGRDSSLFGERASAMAVEIGKRCVSPR